MLRNILSYFNSDDRKLKSYIRSITGVRPRKTELYRLVFCHCSVCPEPEKSNERLELLGDSVLDMIVCEYLYKKYPYKDEGFITALRSKVVNRKQLNTIGEKLGLLNFLQYNKRSMNAGGKDLCGNTFEALIGAIYLDQGLDATRLFVRRRVLQSLLDIDDLEATNFDYKSKLYQLSQREGWAVEFRTRNESQRQRRSYFQIDLLVNNENVGCGEGFSKKEAEQLAAMKALSLLEGRVEAR